MKIMSIVRWSAGVLSVAALTALGGAAAENQSDATPAKEKQYTGKVEYVNGQEHTVKVRGLIRNMTFDLGTHCAITRWNHTTGTIHDLRPGQKVTISYQDVQGVLAAADSVKQETMYYRGIVKTVPGKRILALHRWDRDRKFVLAEDCTVILHDEENSTLDSIKPGDHVTVVYESPSGVDIAFEITQPSARFTGAVVAIDVPHRTVSVEGTFGVRQFSLGNIAAL